MFLEPTTLEDGMNTKEQSPKLITMKLWTYQTELLAVDNI